MAMDRNQRAKAQFAAGLNRKRMADAIGTGQVNAVDRFTQPIEVGKLCVYQPNPDIMLWEVTEVRPVLDPGAPPGMVRVTCATSITMVAYVSQPIRNLLIVGDKPGTQETQTPPSDDAQQQDERDEQQQADDVQGRAEFDRGQLEDLAPPPTDGPKLVTEN